MTDRFNSLTVVFEKNIREDDAQNLINAIKQFRGVLSVDGNVAELCSYVAETRVKFSLRKKLYEVLHEDV